MTIATIEEVQQQLPALIAALKPGEELVIVEHDRPVARLVAEPVKTMRRPPPGSAAGKLIINEDIDDDVHLKDFEEYMP